MGAGGDGRARILTVARDLFVRRGYADVSMQQIADAAGLTKAALYYHFRDKDDLFAQVVLREFRRLRQAAAGVIAEHRSLEDRLSVFTHLWLTLFQGDFHRMMQDFEGHATEQRLDRTLQEEFQREFEAGQEMVAQAFSTAEPPVTLRLDPQFAAMIFSHMLLALTHPTGGRIEDNVSHAHHMPDDPDAMVATLIDVFLHGAVVAPESAPPRARRAVRLEARQRGRAEVTRERLQRRLDRARADRPR